MSYLAHSSYATSATTYGSRPEDAYYTLGQTDPSGNIVIPDNLTVKGTLTVNGASALQGSTVVGGATAAPTVVLDVQSSAGRIEVAPSDNYLSIQGFDANGATAPIGINVRDALAAVNLPAVNATSLSATGALAAASATLSGLVSAATAGGAAFTAISVPDAPPYTKQGYWELGNILIQWGYSTTVSPGAGEIVFPRSFQVGSTPAVMLTPVGTAPIASNLVSSVYNVATYYSSSVTTCYIAIGVTA